jgi:hypothetical protein
MQESSISDDVLPAIIHPNVQPHTERDDHIANLDTKTAMEVTNASRGSQ